MIVCDDCQRVVESPCSEPGCLSGRPRYRVEFDSFEGVEIGSYTTLEGKEGVVLQQIGTRVVHVYGRKHLVPVPT